VNCPHCRTAFHEAWFDAHLQTVPEGHYIAQHLICPECRRIVINLKHVTPDGGTVVETHLLWPKHSTRPVPSEVDARFADDFREAAAVISISPKASAAVSRRCLQDVLREKAGVKAPNLDQEIQKVMDSKATPTWLSENLDAVRVVGNFAAHPTKSTQSGAVVDVEPGEAEFLLDVLEGLFDFYFVQPAKSQAQRAAINAKLKAANKPPLKK
jgi:hypothetical protein